MTLAVKCNCTEHCLQDLCLALGNHTNLFFLVFYIIMSANSSNHGHNLRVTAWNCRGIKGSIPYLRTLMEMSDIIALSEHKLYEPELRILSDISTYLH